MSCGLQSSHYKCLHGFCCSRRGWWQTVVTEMCWTRHEWWTRGALWQQHPRMSFTSSVTMVKWCSDIREQGQWRSFNNSPLPLAKGIWWPIVVIKIASKLEMAHADQSDVHVWFRSWPTCEVGTWLLRTIGKLTRTRLHPRKQRKEKKSFP